MLSNCADFIVVECIGALTSVWRALCSIGEALVEAVKKSPGRPLQVSETCRRRCRYRADVEWCAHAGDEPCHGADERVLDRVEFVPPYVATHVLVAVLLLGVEHAHEVASYEPVGADTCADTCPDVTSTRV